jgi:hypothetical protein
MKNMIFISIICFGLVSCYKDEEPCNSTHTDVSIDLCLQSYFFDSGSSWTYQDTLTLQTNTTTMNSWSHEYVNSKSGPGCANTSTLEQYSLNYYNSLRGSYTQEYIASSIDINGSGESKLLCSSNLDSLIVNGITYYNVLRADFPPNAFHPQDSYTLFFKDSIGVIRRVENSTTVYNLISYNVTYFNPL